MIVEILIGLIAICVVGYAMYWLRKRMKWDRIRQEQAKKLRLLKEKTQGGE
jgi:NhaP-type Na+/H+ or K+/H+ antiporter